LFEYICLFLYFYVLLFLSLFLFPHHLQPKNLAVIFKSLKTV
jgi:hypothetical protein